MCKGNKGSSNLLLNTLNEMELSSGMMHAGPTAKEQVIQIRKEYKFRAILEVARVTEFEM